MSNVLGVRVVAGLFAVGLATVLGQGCGSNPGSVGGGSGDGGRTSVTINLGLGGQSYGLGGQSGIRVAGSGGMAADAASTDAPAARKDARTPGTASDGQDAPPTRTDGGQAVSASLPDVRAGADRATALDVAGKEAKGVRDAAVRDSPSVMDAGRHLDADVPDQAPPGIDGPEPGGLDAEAATEAGEPFSRLDSAARQRGPASARRPSERTGLLRRLPPLAA